MFEILAAIIGAIATFIATYISVIAARRQAEAVAASNSNDPGRVLSSAELEAIKVQSSPVEQLGLEALDLPKPQTGKVAIRLIYPGSSEFHRGDRDVTSTIYYSTSYSDVTVRLDGEKIGSGNGEHGFNIIFETNPGRHTFVFSWKGEQTRYSNSGSRDTDLSGQVTLILWMVRAGQCKIFIDENFRLDHTEPNIVLPTCYTCKMPGIRHCMCGREHCDEHKSLMYTGRCLACENAALQVYYARIRYTLYTVATVSGIAALCFWIF